MTDKWRRDVLNAGYVVLTNISGPVRRPDRDFDADITDVARAARLSFDNEATSRPRENDIRLAARLYRDKHTSPFETIVAWFDVKAPIYVFRQWTRHRTWHYAHVNEVSRRYTAKEIEFYSPGPLEWRAQSGKNKQGSDGYVDIARSTAAYAMHKAFTAGFSSMYRILLDFGITRELARNDIPSSAYTRMSVSVDLLNLTHMLALRESLDAQYEIRVYAKAMHDLLECALPGYSEIVKISTE